MLDASEPIVFVAKVQPGQTLKFSERIKGEGTIQSVKVRFFQGQQLSLHVRPYVLHKGNKIEDIVTYPEGTNQYLSGDDDYLVFDVVCPVENDDELYVWVHNTDPDDTYTLNVAVTIDYLGGKHRAV